MVTALTKILSASLDNTKKINSFIKVQDELEYIKLYLFIQKNRFQDKLQYKIEIEDQQLLELYIPRLSIEPIVENAVIHGIEDNLNQGEVSIRIQKNENHLDVIVCDNGKGFNVDEFFRNGDAQNNNGHNIGIVNTKKRLELLFGNSYGLKYDSKLGTGTKVLIKFPIIKRKNDFNYKEGEQR